MESILERVDVIGCVEEETEWRSRTVDLVVPFNPWPTGQELRGLACRPRVKR